MARLLVFIDWLLGFYAFILIVAAGMSWLIAFDVISARNNLVKSVLPTLFVLTEPALRPIRRFVPPLGGLDLSFLVLTYTTLSVVLKRVVYNLYHPSLTKRCFRRMIRPGLRLK